MEQQYEEMQKAKKRFWRIFLPLLIYLGVRFIANGIAEIIAISAHINQVVDMKLVLGMTMQEQMEYMEKISADATTIATFAKILIENSTLISTIVAVLTFPVGLIFFLIDKNVERITKNSRLSKASIWNYPLIVILGMMICVGLNIILIMCDLSFFGGSTSQSLSATYASSFLLQMIGVGIFVPIAEEFFYRGVLYHRYRENSLYARAAVYSGILFAIAHGSTIQMIFAFVLGMLLAYVYEKYGSIAAPILMHISVNVTSIIFTKIDAFSWLLSKPMRAGITAVVCAFISSSVIVYLQNMEGREYDSI